ncbi:MAG: S8 family peptidase [Archangium sp.]|nr:S8 family peptidase [Archangium sp.]
MQKLLTLSTVVTMSLALAACTRASEDEVDLSRPSYVTADLPDDLTARVPGRLVVDFVDGTTKAEFDEMEKDWGIDLEFNSEEEGPLSAITQGAYEGDLDELLAKIKANPKVEAAEPLMTVKANFVPNDPMYAQQWNMKAINIEKAWEVTKGKGVVVAVLDTGIAWENHDDFAVVPDLEGQKFASGWDFVNDDDHANDDHGHGTHVAGTIAQATNNGEGVVGVAFESTLMAVKVLDHFGSGNTADIADAIHWAADHGAKVINMSLGGGGRSDVMEHAVAYARAKGVVVVCAAGNGGRGVVEYPAAYPGSFAVAAVGPTGAKAPYSSWGKELDIAAPGGDKSQGEAAGIVQNTIDPQDVGKGIYASYQGTSMATPHVAGVAALLYAAGAKNPDQVEKALVLGAKPAPGTKGWSDQFGHGLLDAEGALKALKKLRAADTSELLPVEAQLAQLDENQAKLDELIAQQDVSVYSYSATNWKVFGWGAALLAFVLLTLGRKERPGYLNVLASPGFLIPMFFTTVGAFFVQYVASPSSVSTMITLPIPDWLNKIIFGRGALANPLVYSAAIPVVASIFAIKFKGIRPVVGGLAIGFAAILGYTIWANAPALAWMPFTFLAIPWLAVNALVCLFVSRAMLKKEA